MHKPKYKPIHQPNCDCAVCWVNHYCDALKLFPLTQEELSRPFINYYAYYDYTAEFKREQRTSDRVERASS